MVIGFAIALVLGMVITLNVHAWGSVATEAGGSCGSANPCPHGTIPVLIPSFLALFVLLPAAFVVIVQRFGMGGNVGRIAAAATLVVGLVGVIPGNAIWHWAHGPSAPGLSTAWQLAKQSSSQLQGQGSWIVGGTVIRAQADQVAAYEIDGGGLKWTYDVPDMALLCSMSRDTAGTVGVIAYGSQSSSCDSMVALDLVTGHALWHKDLSGNGLPNSPRADFIAAAGDLAFVATPDPADRNGVQAFDIHTGAPKWHVTLSDDCQPEAIGGNLTVIVRCLQIDMNAANPGMTTQFHYSVQSYDPTTGAQRWDTPLQFRGSNASVALLSASPLVIELRETDARGRDRVISVSDTGQTQGQIDATSASLYLFGSGFRGQGNLPVVVANGMIVARSTPRSANTYLVGYRLADGQRIWSANLTHNSVQSLARDGDRVVTLTESGFRESLVGYNLKTGAAQPLGTSGIDLLTATVSMHVVNGAYVIMDEDGNTYPPITVLN